MIERLIESWLDSQTERQYQPAFVQALVSEGWTVLHNSRHSPIELGKDVIARDPQGALHFFQLKGNPGARFTKNQAQQHLNQLLELIHVPASPTFYLKDDEKATAVLVTNGTIDEEADVELDRLRSNLKSSRTKEFLLWSRGSLLALYQRNSAKVWPTSLEGVRAVLNMHAADGAENIDVEKLGALNEQLLPQGLSTSATEAMIGQYGVISQILKAPWLAANNHYALFALSVVQTMQLLPLRTTGKRSAAVVHQMLEGVLNHAEDLLQECVDRGYVPDKVWAARDFVAEQPIMLERRALIAHAAATLMLSPRWADLAEPIRAKATEIVAETYPNASLWGEAAVVGQVVNYFALSRTSKVEVSPLPLAETLQFVCVANERQSASGQIPSFYYTFEQVWRFHNDIRFTGDDDLFNDSFVGRSSTARTLLLLLVSAGCKNACQHLWGPFSQLMHEGAALDDGPMFFSPVQKKSGTARSFGYHGSSWSEMRELARTLARQDFLAPYEELHWLIAAYVAIVPFRGWTEVMLWLGSRMVQPQTHGDCSATPEAT